MDYRNAIDRLYDLRRYAFEPGTERTERVLATLDDPHRSFDAVQIAGTNGKGSTASMLASILSEAGFRVGLYTSPHLESFHERIQVDGRPITEDALARFVTEIDDHLDSVTGDSDAPTFFEVTTALAYWYFAEESVDVAVIEIGIGGSKDATSVVDPIGVAITSIALEHTDILGETVTEIVTDKASIVSEGTPVVTGVTGSARSTLLGLLEHAIVVGADDEAAVNVGYLGVDEHFEAEVAIAADRWDLVTRSPLIGRAQAVNAGVAATLAREVFDLPVEDIANGIRGVSWPGRVEVLDRHPLVVADGAHNPAACIHLRETLSELDFDELHLVFGAMEDKDIPAMADSFEDASSVTTCRPTTPRAADPDGLAGTFDELGIPRVNAGDAVLNAVEEALETASSDDCVLITGSLFTVGEARTRWTRPVTGRRITGRDDARDALERCHLDEQAIERRDGLLVHRVLRTRLDRQYAEVVESECSQCGCDCIISPLELDGNPLEVLISGTQEALDDLTTRLHRRGDGLSSLATQLDNVTGRRSTQTSGAYPWETAPVVMGIINPTPDSFHDGGRFDTEERAIERAHQFIDEGAAIVDVGGESTRPGGEPVPDDVELSRILPVIEAIADRDVLVSVDTRKADVAEEAITAGADMINDVSGLSDPAMPTIAARYEVPLVLMHSHATPVDPTKRHEHDDIVEEVYDVLHGLIRRCRRFGLDRSDLIVDPGIGFGKSKVENFALLDRLDELAGLGCPILVGHSNKSMFELVDLEAGESRRPGTIAGTALAVERGADILRVHDVAENVAAVDTAQAVRRLH